MALQEGRAFDTIVVYKILKLLSTPIKFKEGCYYNRKKRILIPKSFCI